MKNQYSNPSGREERKNKALRIFAVMNGYSDSDFGLSDDFQSGGSNAHSGGVVVIAETLEEAQTMVDKAILKDDGYNLEERNVGTLKEIELKKGVVIFAGGDC